jgi:hypothetical protein
MVLIECDIVAGASAPGGVDCVILRAGGTACSGPFGSVPVPVMADLVAIAITEYRAPCELDSRNGLEVGRARSPAQADEPGIAAGNPTR